MTQRLLLYPRRHPYEPSDCNLIATSAILIQLLGNLASLLVLYLSFQPFTKPNLSIIASLRNRTVEERRRQTVCVKRDKIFNLFLKKNFAKLRSPLNRTFCKRPENINVIEDHDKKRK